MVCDGHLLNDGKFQAVKRKKKKWVINKYFLKKNTRKKKLMIISFEIKHKINKSRVCLQAIQCRYFWIFVWKINYHIISEVFSGFFIIYIDDESFDSLLPDYVRVELDWQNQSMSRLRCMVVWNCVLSNFSDDLTRTSALTLLEIRYKCSNEWNLLRIAPQMTVTF